MFKFISLLAALFIGTGCATTSLEKMPSTGSLEVINVLDVEVELFVNNDFVTKVSPLSRERITGFLPGITSVSLGSSDTNTLSGEVHVVAGGVVPFPQETSPAIEAIPKLTSLRVFNELPEPLEIRVDGRLLGQVLPSDTRLFRSLRETDRRVNARSLNGIVSQTHRLSFGPALQAELRLIHLPTKLELVNASSEPITIQLEDGESHSILPKGSRLFETLSPGSYTLSVLGKGGRSKRMLHLGPGDSLRVELEAGSTSLRLANKTTETVKITHKDFQLTTLPPGKSVQLNGLPDHSYPLQATMLESGHVFSRTFSLTTGVTPVWVLQLREGSLRIENDTPEPVQAVVRGQSALVIPPGEMRLIQNLPVGQIEGSAVGRFSTRSYSFQEDLVSTETLVWNILDGGGSLEVINGDAIPRRFFFPEVGEFEVPANAGIVLDDIAAGSRILDVKLAPGIERVPVEIQAFHRTRLTLRERTLEAKIHNESGETLHFRSRGKPVQEIRPGDTFTLNLTPGPHELKVEGTQSKVIFSKVLQVQNGDSAEWTVLPYGGLLHIENLLGETVEVRIPGRESFRVAPKDTRILAPIPIGLLRIAAKGMQSGKDYTYQGSVSGERVDHWKIVRTTAALLVSNQSNEPQNILLDGNPATLLPPGASSVLRVPGETPTELITQSISSQAVERVHLVLRDAEERTHTISPSQAPLRVTNNTQESATLYNPQWESPLEIPAGKIAQSSLKLGKTTLQGAFSGDSYFSREISVSKDQVNPIELASHDHRIWVHNKTDQEITLYGNDTYLGTLAPGIRTPFTPFEQATAMTLKAVASDGTTWMRAAQTSQSSRKSWTLIR